MTLIFPLLIVALMIASQWKVFEKAGQPGWACLVPIYNIYIMVQIAKKPMSYFWLILFVPIANIVFAIMLINGISKAFGKTEGFTAGLIFLGIVFWPILAFGDAKYQLGEATSSEDLLDS
jgi:arginine exporter protein ArgO